MKTILVIEDETSVRANILTILQAEGYATLEAANGREGVRLAMQHLPDLVIADIMMPELDGFGVLRELRSSSATGLIPFLFLSARADKADIREGMKLGADDYLTKPFRMKELLEAVEVRLQKREQVTSHLENTLETLRKNLSHSLPHEFLTPMTSILGCSKILVESYDTLRKDDIQEMHLEIDLSAKRLLQLIQKFLLFAKLERAEEDEEEQRWMRNSVLPGCAFYISNAAQNCVKTYEREADLTLDVEDATLAVRAAKFNGMIQELVDNALKFSSAGSPVVIRGVVTGDNMYKLSFSDKGRGMNARQIAAIGAYMQFDRSQYEQQGSGLGLAIAAKVARLHGGTLDINSTPSNGTTVVVTLPLAHVV